MIRPTFCLLLIACVTLAATAQTRRVNRAFKGGERLQYELFFNWKFVWFRVGDASLHTSDTTYQGQRALNSYLITNTSKRADRYFVMRDTLQSIMTTQLVPLYYHKGALEGKRYRVDRVWYSYPHSQCQVKQCHIKKDGSVHWKTQRNNLDIYDMLAMFQNARNFDMDKFKKGQRVFFLMTDAGKVKREALMYQGKKNVKMNGRSTTYRCLVFTYLDYDDGKEKKMVTFYVTDDANHVPVRLDMELKFGTAKAYLTAAHGLRNAQTAVVKK